MNNFKIPQNLIEEFEISGVLALGEYHGVKENYWFYEEFLNQLPFTPNIAVELKDSERLELEKFLTNKEIDYTKFNKDGRANVEFFNFLKKFKDVNPESKILCFDEIDTAPKSNDEVNYTRDEQMAINFLNNYEKPTLIIAGNLHIQKSKINLGTSELVPMGYLMKNKIGNFPTILVIPTSGSFFNNEIKQIKPIVDVKINEILEKGDMNYRYYIEESHPVTIFNP
jgi:hypothetical protein